MGMKLTACVILAALLFLVVGCQKEIKEIRGNGRQPVLAQAQ
jgi:hypothetical protein